MRPATGFRGGEKGKGRAAWSAAPAWIPRPSISSPRSQHRSRPACGNHAAGSRPWAGDAILSLPPRLQHLRLPLVGAPRKSRRLLGKRGTRGRKVLLKQVPPEPRSHRPPQSMASPAPFRAMLPLSPLDSPEVTHKQRAFCFPALPCRAESEGGNDALSAPSRRRDAQSGACLLQSGPCPTGTPRGEVLWTKTFRLAGRQEGRLSDNATQVSGPESDSAGSLFPPQLEGIAWLEKSPLASASLVFSLSALAGSGQAGRLASQHHS